MNTTDRKLWRNWQRVGFQTRRLGVRLPLASIPMYAFDCELGLVGYDNCLTRNGSRVRFSELVLVSVIDTHIFLFRCE